METTLNAGARAGAKTPWHLWVVGAVSLLWNSGGAISYTTTKLGMLEGSGMPAEQIEYLANIPAWASAFWALGVWGCLLGSAALLLRSRFATMLFGISLVGLMGLTVYQRLLSDLPASYQTIGHSLFAALIWVITIALFIYARRQQVNGVLR